MTTTVVQSRGDLDAAIRDIEHQGTGDVAFTYVVSPDGRFVPGSAAVVSSTNPSVTQDALAMYESCRYAPGRVAGIPVATRLEARLQSRITVGP